MKKTYLTPPEVRIGIPVQLEKNFLTSNVNIGGSTGEDLGDPDPYDPFS